MFATLLIGILGNKFYFLRELNIMAFVLVSLSSILCLYCTAHFHCFHLAVSCAPVAGLAHAKCQPLHGRFGINNFLGTLKI